VDGLYFEECRVGDSLLTDGRTVTRADVMAFAELTGDENPVHTDADYARQSVFGEQIAHGMLSLSFGLGLLFRHGGFGSEARPLRLIAITGMKNVRFLVPVKIGDALRLNCSIVEKRRLPGRKGTVTMRFRILNQSDQTAVAGRIAALVECRDS